MKFFNPHEIQVPKGRPPKNAIPNPVHAASVWEGLRHNYFFRTGVLKVLEGSVSDEVWIAFRNYYIPRWCLERMQESLPSIDEETIQTSGKPSFMSGHGKEDLLSIDQPWPDTPDWFRQEFPFLVNDRDLSITTQLGDQDIATELLSLFRQGREEDSGLSWAELEIHLQQMEGRLVLLPNAVLDGATETKKILGQVKPLLNQKHGNRLSYPSRENWYAYIMYAKGMEIYAIENMALGFALKRMNPEYWGDLFGLRKDKVEENEIRSVRREIARVKRERRVGVFEQIEQTEEFISSLFSSS